MRLSNIFIVVILLTNYLSAQNSFVKQWDKRFGGTDEDHLTCFQPTTDGGYILGGWSVSGISGDKTQGTWGNSSDYWVVKIDSLGNKQWDKRFGGIGYDFLHALEQTKDGGYILGGYTNSGAGGDKTEPSFGVYDFWVVKIDSLGSKQWDKGFGSGAIEIPYALQQTTDGGYIIGGYIGFLFGGGEDFWVVKIDSLGNKQWDKRFGGTGSEMLYALTQTTDGGYIFGGHSNSGISGSKSQDSWNGSADYWVIKTDSTGNKQWDRRFGGDDADYVKSLIQTADNGYVLGGLSSSGVSGDKTVPNSDTSTYPQDYWLVKIDSIGNKEWDNKFGGLVREDDFGNVYPTSDGGYLLTGTSYSPASGDKSEDNLGSEQIWIVKTNSLGVIEWDRTIFTDGHEENVFSIETTNRCYVIANEATGGIAGYKTQANWGSYDYWIIKFCDTVTIVPCSSLSISTSVTSNVSSFGASDGAAKVIATGGNPPYGYIWSDGQTSSTGTGFSAGAYTVTVTDSRGCEDSTSIFIEEGPLTNNISPLDRNAIEFYPNPTQHIITLDLSNIHGLTLIKLYDAFGRLVLEKMIDTGLTQFNEQLDLSNLNGNIFFLTINSETANKVMKIIKQE